VLVVDVPHLLDRLGIPAERRGREWWARCPLPEHDDRTPSWQMHDDPEEPDKHGRWRCLGRCHTGGGPATLVARVLGLVHPETGEPRTRAAWRWIADGSAVEEAPVLDVALAAAPRRPAGIGRGFRLPPGVAVEPLDLWPAAARAYAEQRGITAEQVDRWGLGYAVDGRMSGRIVLPWRDARGRLLGYTARTFVHAVKKYLEPREDEGADRNAVYGEEHWPPPGDARGTLVVVEGGIDGYAVERATGLPFGAVCGSQLLPGHVARISTFQEVIVASDPDGAGSRFADALWAALARWTRVRRAAIPAGSDPAKLERVAGPAALADALGCRASEPR
jgi:DNA primase